ncbi:LptF/LptG family permease, partial [Vibrio owensii]|uniref:LptF/LptG family permease n=1 Tax=Vibrio owensii TaxID=696485 RepID=UPI004067AFE1
SILIELHKKISYPLACVIFVLIALPLSITSNRSGSGISFGLTTVIIFFYYLLMVAGETMGKQGLINPSISMYIPASITVSLAFFLLWQRIY